MLRAFAIALFGPRGSSITKASWVHLWEDRPFPWDVKVQLTWHFPFRCPLPFSQGRRRDKPDGFQAPQVHNQNQSFMSLNKSLSWDGIFDWEETGSSYFRKTCSATESLLPPGRWWKCLFRCFLAVAFATGLAHSAAGSVWERVSQASESIPRFTLDPESAKNLITGAAMEFPLPLPDGSIATFQVENSDVMPPELAARFPQIRSFSGVLKGDPQTTVKLDFSSSTLRAKIFTPKDVIHVLPMKGEDGIYISLAARDLELSDALKCLPPLDGPKNLASQLASRGIERGGRQLRTYRIAIASIGEFTQSCGGTVSGAMATIVHTVNQVNGIYEKELGIRLQLVANNDRLIFLNPDRDPYSENAATTTTLLENQNTVDSVIGAGNYDIGHFFHTGAFGLAYSGVVCRDGWKARGGFGSSTPGGTLFPDLVAHEIAHQFGANHTFNSSEGLCGSARNPGTAYEPGSGSTIMAYAGFCGGDNLQGNNNPYFHSVSYDEIMRFVTTDSGANCASVTPTGNNPPSVDAGTHFIIPKGTAFTLSASGSDPDGDAVTYCWEQWDRGPAQSVYAGDNGESALFRSLPPTPNPNRTFPRLQSILNNSPSIGETAPQTSRTLHFRVTARDNRSGIATADTEVAVTESGPFQVTSHTSGETLHGAQTITWDVAGASGAPVSAPHVNILLSTNGGAHFNVTLAANVPNDGSERVLFPNADIPSARIKIEAVGHIFFAINQSNFSIRPYFSVPDFNMDGKVDLLWQNSKGQLTGWLMNGSTFLRSATVRNQFSMPPQWRLAGMYDFNSDAKVDLLWQHSNGATLIWFMDGPNFIGLKSLRNGFRMASGWRLVGASDFDDDTQPDILWQHTNGRIVVWKMSGSDFVQNVLLQNGKPSNPGWRAVGLSDFNANGGIDILFRHDSGSMAVWLMQGFAVKRNQILNTPKMSLAWNLGALADLDGNGQNDLVWNHTDGSIQISYMSGFKAFRSGTLRNARIQAEWRLVGPR